MGEALGFAILENGVVIQFVAATSLALKRLIGVQRLRTRWIAVAAGRFSSGLSPFSRLTDKSLPTCWISLRCLQRKYVCDLVGKRIFFCLLPVSAGGICSRLCSGAGERDGNLPACSRHPFGLRCSHAAQNCIRQDDRDGGEGENKCPITYVPSKGGSSYLTAVIFSRAVAQALYYSFSDIPQKKLKQKNKKQKNKADIYGNSHHDF